MNRQHKRKKIGRPFQGFTRRVMTRVTEDAAAWLDALSAEHGLRRGDLVRRILDDARARGWCAS